jgi:hypothetical protein
MEATGPVVDAAWCSRERHLADKYVAVCGSLRSEIKKGVANGLGSSEPVAPGALDILSLYLSKRAPAAD